jgi:hypothetical protein
MKNNYDGETKNCIGHEVQEFIPGKGWTRVSEPGLTRYRAEAELVCFRAADDGSSEYRVYESLIFHGELV